MDSEEVKTPEEMIVAFSRCINYPRDKEGILIFAQELHDAADQTGVSMQEIVDKCREVADRAPEFADMLNVAREIKTTAIDARVQEETSKQEANWRKQYGAPQKVVADWTLADVANARRRDMEMRKKVCERLDIRPDHPDKNRRDLQNVCLRDRFQAQRDLGYPLTPEQAKYLQ